MPTNTRAVFSKSTALVVVLFMQNLRYFNAHIANICHAAAESKSAVVFREVFPIDVSIFNDEEYVHIAFFAHYFGERCYKCIRACFCSGNEQDVLTGLDNKRPFGEYTDFFF